MQPLKGQAAAYVCIRHMCKQPTSDLKTFAKLLTTL